MKKFTYIVLSLILLSVILISKSSYAVKHVVQVGNFFFNPSSLNVNVGDTIRWVLSAGNHTTTSTPGAIPAGAAAWDAPINSSNTSFEYKVVIAGSYAYVCTPHAPGMAGTFTAAAATPTLSVAPSNRNVTSLSGSTTFTVTSNSNWNAGSSASWCTVTSGGIGNGTINANYTENTSVTQRIATITVMVSGLPDQIVTVTQAGAAPTLTVGPANQNVSASSGTTTFSVTSNTSWTVASNAAWCTVVPSGNGNASVIATYNANSSNVVRTASLTFTVSGLPPQTVTVTQAASTVGIGDINVRNMQVYPNPTKGIFQLTPGEYITPMTISVMDMSGKIVLTRICNTPDEFIFDISRESEGYYFIRIESGNNTQVRKIVLMN